MKISTMGPNATIGNDFWISGTYDVNTGRFLSKEKFAQPQQLMDYG
jgi:hypothetical protein